MARLSKENLGDRGRFRFKQEEVELPELDGSVVVRSPSVSQRDELSKETPDDPKEWTIKDTAKLFAMIVVEPDVSEDEAAEFLGDWPGPALDRVVEKFAEMTGTKEEKRTAVGDFPGVDGGS